MGEVQGCGGGGGGVTIDPAILWLLSGIGSCLIFVFAERDMIREIEFSNAVLLVLILLGLCILGPAGLAVFLLGLLITFLANL